jgi:hypothetical protein
MIEITVAIKGSEHTPIAAIHATRMQERSPERAEYDYLCEVISLPWPVPDDASDDLPDLTERRFTVLHKLSEPWERLFAAIGRALEARVGDAGGDDA